ncbi:hypothetical protein Syun_016803 [Stephania yunnanensis]|uniref:Uncharacterized protein n=1 Tax=Stephania yunnanensis TaxID=152371 RepID=A0AAP0P587_9MAGN
MKRSANRRRRGGGRQHRQRHRPAVADRRRHRPAVEWRAVAWMAVIARSSDPSNAARRPEAAGAAATSSDAGEELCGRGSADSDADEQAATPTRQQVRSAAMACERDDAT